MAAPTGVNAYDVAIGKCKTFLSGFKPRGTDDFKYMTQLTEIANRRSDILTIDLDDIYEFDTEGEKFVAEILKNVLRYETTFLEAADALVAEIPATDNEGNVDDMFAIHRQALANNVVLPSSLMRRYELVLNTPRNIQELSVRQLRGDHVGSLVKVKAMVTRVTEVKPKMTVATYTCSQCAGETFQSIKSNEFMPLSTCEGEECQTNAKNAKLVMQTRGSKFIRYQEIRVQELAQHVPVGHTPRSITLHARGSSTRVTNPGDSITVVGIYLPSLETGFKAMRTGLLATTYISTYSIVSDKKEKITSNMSAKCQEQLASLIANPEDSYVKLSQSLAPEIFGHADVKKALMLLLIGGVGKSENHNLKIRGDLNMCLMGDPGVAKSQLMKYICSVATRGIYTTGKGSSGVGLTASIQKDPITEDLVLEGGALVLADKGICAIDEFDKMDEMDRTAIYEVMEQQTISIAKAGITTTLNARTSILAAANPMYGRYNDQKSLTENINLPAALLSRFDLLFLLLDRPSIEDDIRLAEHVTHVHRHSRHPDIGFEPMEMDVIRAYVAKCKEYTPNVGTEVTDYLVDMYVEIRNRSTQEKSNELKTTPRTLLALIRLATAIARLRLSNEVIQNDIDEAFRLMNAASVSLNAEKDDRRERKRHYKDYIYGIIQSMLNAAPNGMISYDRCRRSVVNRGYNVKQFESTISAYQETEVLMVDDQRTLIKALS